MMPCCPVEAIPWFSRRKENFHRPNDLTRYATFSPSRRRDRFIHGSRIHYPWPGYLAEGMGKQWLQGWSATVLMERQD